jgi:hypothetical protein
MAKKGRGLVYIIMAIERRKGKERKRAWLGDKRKGHSSGGCVS